MKLAEALALRADAQRRLAQIRARAESSARYQEGEEPAESATELLAEGGALIDEIERLVRAINRTNSATEMEPGVTITDAIARRDALSLRRAMLTAVADAAAGRDERQFGARQLRSELRHLTDVPVAEVRREADRVARDYRQLDLQLQAANWGVDLID